MAVEVEYTNAPPPPVAHVTAACAVVPGDTVMCAPSDWLTVPGIYFEIAVGATEFSADAMSADVILSLEDAAEFHRHLGQMIEEQKARHHASPSE